MTKKNIVETPKPPFDSDRYLKLKRTAPITLSNDAFDKFVDACLDPNPPKPNAALVAALHSARQAGMIV